MMISSSSIICNWLRDVPCFISFH